MKLAEMGALFSPDDLDFFNLPQASAYRSCTSAPTQNYLQLLENQRIAFMHRAIFDFSHLDPSFPVQIHSLKTTFINFL